MHCHGNAVQLLAVADANNQLKKVGRDRTALVCVMGSGLIRLGEAFDGAAQCQGCSVYKCTGKLSSIHCS